MRTRPVHFPGAFYHVMLRGNRKQEIFRDERDSRHLERLVAASLDRYNSEVHAYCWMSNHIHLLMRVREVPLYRSVHYFAMMYAKYFNRRHGLVGHLFQGRYKSRLVDSDSYFLQLIRYIHRNPVEAGLVHGVEQYPWSSMRCYLGLRSIPWLSKDCVSSYFDYKADRLLRFIEEKGESFDPWEGSGDTENQDEPVYKKMATDGTRWSALDELIIAACQLFDVTQGELEGSGTRRELTLARCWTVVEAKRTNLATLSFVARRFNRSPAALSKSIRVNAKKLADIRQEAVRR